MDNPCNTLGGCAKQWEIDELKQRVQELESLQDLDDELSDLIEQQLSALQADNERLRGACLHVLQDDGYVPRATSDCREVVRQALQGDKD